jgi:lipoate-protein ligase A
MRSASARLILEPAPTPGAWNMAVDETLLESSLANGTSTIRLYQWSAPTVSLGYFQDANEFERDGLFAGLAAVRRLSGGGAILHDREITYSITLPPSHPLTAHPSQLYRLAHEAIIAVLAEHGIVVHMRDMPSLDPRPSTIDPFLCFGRGDPNDIVLGAHKIVGSAQRRRRGAILQHGSVLLERSPHATEFPGLCELTGINLDRAALSTELSTAVADAMGSKFTSSALTAAESKLAGELQAARYSTLRWRPSPDPSMTIDD